MADLTGQVEHHILTLNQMLHGVASDVGDDSAPSTRARCVD